MAVYMLSAEQSICSNKQLHGSCILIHYCQQHRYNLYKSYQYFSSKLVMGNSCNSQCQTDSSLIMQLCFRKANPSYLSVTSSSKKVLETCLKSIDAVDNNGLECATRKIAYHYSKQSQQCSVPPITNYYNNTKYVEMSQV